MNKLRQVQVSIVYLIVALEKSFRLRPLSAPNKPNKLKKLNLVELNQVQDLKLWFQFLNFYVFWDIIIALLQINRSKVLIFNAILLEYVSYLRIYDSFI